MQQMTKNMRNEAYSELRYRIMHNKFIPGQKISEKTISEELGIGRTPVREAIIRIERDGLIDVIPQSGTYISQIDMEKAKDARFVRQNVEVEIMLEATAKMTDAAYHEQKVNLREQAVAIQKEDPDTFFDLDEAFHHEFYTIAGRDNIWDWLQTVNMQLNRFRWIRLKVNTLNWQTIIQQHENLLDVVYRRDLEDVRFQTTAHLRLMLQERKYLLDKFPGYFMNVSPSDQTDLDI